MTYFPSSKRRAVTPYGAGRHPGAVYGSAVPIPGKPRHLPTLRDSWVHDALAFGVGAFLFVVLLSGIAYLAA